MFDWGYNYVYIPCTATIFSSCAPAVKWWSTNERHTGDGRTRGHGYKVRA